MAPQLALVAAAIATLLSCSVNADEAAMQAIVKCSKESNIKMETLMKACDEDMTGIPGYKCFSKCVQMTMGIMSADGSVSPADATKFVTDEDKDVALKAATECSKEVAATDLCEKASAIDQCMQKKDPAIYKKSCMALLAKIMS